jgi:hypothetical protein
MNNQIVTHQPIPPAPIHPLAAMVTVVLDNFFGVLDILDPFFILFTVSLVTMVGTASTTLVQRYLSKDDWGTAIAKGLAMGIIAGVPFPVTGTAIGLPLLAWAGLHEWVRLPSPKSQPDHVVQETIDSDTVDAEYVGTSNR